MNRFDRVFWARLWKLARPYWVSDKKWVALALLATTLLLTGFIRGTNIVFSYVNRDMMTALTDRNASVFFHSVLLIAIYSRVSAPIIAFDGYVNARQMIYWRKWLTERFLDESFRDRAFYRISSNPGIDNPDQRISEDLNAFPGFVVSFVLQVFWGIVTRCVVSRRALADLALARGCARAVCGNGIGVDGRHRSPADRYQLPATTA